MFLEYAPEHYDSSVYLVGKVSLDSGRSQAPCGERNDCQVIIVHFTKVLAQKFRLMEPRFIIVTFLFIIS